MVIWVEVKHGLVSFVQNPRFGIVSLKLETFCYQHHTIEREKGNCFWWGQKELRINQLIFWDIFDWAKL